MIELFERGRLLLHGFCFQRHKHKGNDERRSFSEEIQQSSVLTGGQTRFSSLRQTADLREPHSADSHYPGLLCKTSKSLIPQSRVSQVLSDSVLVVSTGLEAIGGPSHSEPPHLVPLNVKKTVELRTPPAGVPPIPK